MALGDGPVRRVLSLRGGVLSGVGLSYESVTPNVTQAGWVHSLVHKCAEFEQARLQGAARGPTRLRDADGARRRVRVRL